jgi:hypothetical protein
MAGISRDASVSRSETTAKSRTAIYYHAHSRAWFAKNLRDLPSEIHAWRSIDVPMLRAYFHPWLGGRLWLRLVYHAEERFPRLLGRLGAYPLIMMRKENARFPSNSRPTPRRNAF